MRFIGWPQPQVVSSGSWRISRRGRCAGSGCALGLLASRPRLPCRRLHARSISAASAARSASSVSSSRLFCSALKRSDCGGELQPLEHRHLVRELVDERLLEGDLGVALLRPALQQLHGLPQSAGPGCRVCCRRSRSVIVPTAAPTRIGTSGNCASRAATARVITPASPMRCQGRPSTRASSCARVSVSVRAGIRGPDELAAVQPPRGQPHADAVVHQHLHAVGAPVGEQVGVVRPGRAEDR